MKKILLLGLLMFLMLSASAFSSDNSIILDVREFVLENGMKVLILERHSSPTVAVTIIYKVGSVNEQPGITGISHLVEHMLFKGTTHIGTKDYQKEKPLLDKIDQKYDKLLNLKAERVKLPPDRQTALDEEVKQVVRELEELKESAREYRIPDELTMIYQRNGAQGLNASTSEEITDYYCELPANKLELWAWLESDRFSNVVWRDFSEEKDVIMEERRMRSEVNPNGVLYLEFKALCYQAHPLNWPIIGWASDIQSITRQQLDEYFHQYYAPNNAVAIIVGDVETKEVIDLMRKYFEPIPPSPKPVPAVTTVEPVQRGERRVVLELNAKPLMLIGYHTTTIGNPDDYTLDVVSEILTGGRTSRLYRRLVLEKGLCLNIGGYNDVGKYPGLFVFSASPRHPHSAEEVEKALYEELDKLKNEDVSEAELKKAKKNLAAGFLRGLNSNSGLSKMLGHYEGLLSWKYVGDLTARRNAVTKEDIKKVMNKYFTATNRTVAMIVPKQKEK